MVRRLRYQRFRNNHFGIYEYIQVNLAYQSGRMASNRLTRNQIEEIYRTGRVSVAFEPMRVDDLVEAVNHFRCVREMIDTVMQPLTVSIIRRYHGILCMGTNAANEGGLRPGTLRPEPELSRATYNKSIRDRDLPTLLTLTAHAQERFKRKEELCRLMRYHRY